MDTADLYNMLFSTYRRSGDMVHLELHRPQTAASSTSGPTLTSIMKGGNSDSDENNSVQDFTIFDDKTALLHETTVSLNPFRILRRLRAQSCFGFSLTKPVKV